MKIVTIIGARPQFIKAATISRALKEYPDIEEVLVHTGQHYDNNMSDIFFEEMAIPQPNYNLGIGSGRHGAQTGKMLEAIEEVLITEKADWLLVYGDTNSTLAGALAASKLHIPVAHVEAGLRSFNKAMPEEINRILTDNVSDKLFCPTATAEKHLNHEGFTPDKIAVTGDVMYDAALFYKERAKERATVLEDHKLKTESFILATVHRAENTDDPQRMRSLFAALDKIGQQQRLILPLHPRTRNMAEAAGLKLEALSIELIPPVGYLDMVALESAASLILTDSGGVQKEAFFHQTPCITLRTETEWVELLELGVNKLCPDFEHLPAEVENMREKNDFDWEAPLYGNGRAAYKIIDLLR